MSSSPGLDFELALPPSLGDNDPMDPRSSLRVALLNSSVGQSAVRLMLDALPGTTPRAGWFEFDAESEALWQAFHEENIADAAARSSGLTLVTPQDLCAPGEAHHAPPCIRATTAQLPFGAQACAGVLWSFALDRRAQAAAELAELRRVLRHDGCVIFSCLLADSFEVMFDVLLEVSEKVDDVALRAAVRDARRDLPRRQEVESLCATAGLRIEAIGEEERALRYGSGKEAMEDPLFAHALLQPWLRQPLSAAVQKEASQFLDAYLGTPLGVATKVAVVRARPAATPTP